MKSLLLTSKFDAAKMALSRAEVDLAGAVREIRIQPRANKVVISSAIDDAIEKVRGARSTLVGLEALLDEDAGEPRWREPAALGSDTGKGKKK